MYLLMIPNTEIDEVSDYYNVDIDIEKNDVPKTIYHLACIRNLFRLVKSQIIKGSHRTWLCDRCLTYFKYEI